MKDKVKWLVGGILLLVAAVVVMSLVWQPARQAVDIAQEGGEIRLRDAFRPIRGETRLVVIALDGVGDEMLRRAIREGYAPNVAALLGAEAGDNTYEHAYAVPEVLTVAPSMTMAAWTSIFTGEPPAVTGVPGNEWYDRGEAKFYAPGMISVDAPDHILQVYTDGLLGEIVPVPTLWEGLPYRIHVALALLFRGADLLNVPALADVAAMFVSSARGIAEDDEPVERESYRSVDQAAVDRLLESMDEHGVPDVQVAYFPGIDLYTHVAEPPLMELLDYFREVLDPAIGKLIDRYREEGFLEQTYFVFVADHGHTPVLNDPAHSLGSIPENDPHEVIRQAGYRVRPQELETQSEDYQVALAYQGPMAFLYVADRTTCPEEGSRCEWPRPPRMEDDVMPLVRAFDEANRTGQGAPDLAGKIDMIFVREPRPLDQEALPFGVWDKEEIVPLEEYLAEHPREDLPRLKRRMRELAAGPYGHRAGDIILMAYYGGNLPIEERYYFSPKYHSSHGGLQWQDSHIPLVVAHRAYSGEALRDKAQDILPDEPSALDFTPLIRHLLGQ